MVGSLKQEQGYYILMLYIVSIPQQAPKGEAVG